VVYPCDVCGREIKNRQALAMHKASHMKKENAEKIVQTAERKLIEEKAKKTKPIKDKVNEIESEADDDYIW